MKSNTRFNQNKRGIECLNCHQPLSVNDNFCSNCGQVNDLKPLSIKQYISEFFAGFFAFDTRTLNTVIPLLFKPGKVTNEYVHGERMKYVNPFQLYLHTSIIFFLVTGVFLTIDKYDSISNKTEIVKGNDGVFNNSKKVDSIKNEVSKNLKKVSEDLEAQNIIIDFGFGESDEKKKDSIASKLNISNSEIKQYINNQIDSIFSNTKFLNITTNTQISSEAKEEKITKIFNNNISKLYSRIIRDYNFEKDSLKLFVEFKKEFLDQTEVKLKSEKIDYKFNEFMRMSTEDQMINNLLGNSLFSKISIFNKSKIKNVGRALDSLNYPKTRRNIFLYNKAQDINKFKNDKDFRREYLNNMISKTSLVLFFMLPILTLFLKLLYIRRKINYTEHLIFTFHVQTAFFILLLIFIVFNRTFKTDLGVPLFIVLFMVYLFIAMKKYYKQGFIKTAIKYVMLNSMYLFLSIIGSLIVAFLAFVM